MSLARGDWIDSCHSVLITGPTGAGRSWLAWALAQYACRRGRSAYYQRMPRLGEELRIRHGNGTFGKRLIQLAKTDVLLLDDRGMAALDTQARSNLLEIIDDRAASKATIITSSCRSSTGMHGSETPSLPTRSSTAWCSNTTASPSRASLCGRSQKPTQRTRTQTQRDRHFYDLIAQLSTHDDRSRSSGIGVHVRRNTHARAGFVKQTAYIHWKAGRRRRPLNCLSRHDAQAHLDVAPSRLRIGADLVGRMGNFVRDVLGQARQ